MINGSKGDGGSEVQLDYSGRTVLALGAHPDDLELGIGGTLAGLSRGGARVVMAVVSIPNHLQQRAEESARSARVLGGELRLLMPDRCCRVEDLKHHQLVGMIDALVEELAPAAVFTHTMANLHLDHRLVHEACLASCRLAYFDLFCYPPTSCRPVDIPFHPHAYVDISGLVGRKMKAIEAHGSQFGCRGLGAEHVLEMSAQHGKIIGVEHAEGLEVVRLRLGSRCPSPVKTADEPAAAPARAALA